MSNVAVKSEQERHEGLGLVAEALIARASQTPLDFWSVAEVCVEQDVPEYYGHWVLAHLPELRWPSRSNVEFRVCVAECRNVASLELLSRFLEIRSEREREQKPLFDIVTKICMDRCLHRPSVISRSLFGNATHTRMEVEKVRPLIEALCDES